MTTVFRPALLRATLVSTALMLAAASGCRAGPAEDSWTVDLAADRADPARTHAIVWRSLGEDGHRFEWNAAQPLHAASTMKVPVLIELYRRADAGRIDLDGTLVLRNAFTSIVDGSGYALDPADDSDPELYDRLGDRVTYRELGRRMVVRSSNLATNLLVEELGAPSIQATCDALGAPGMKVLRGVEDMPAYRAGRNNETTAEALATLLTAIARGAAASPAGCEEMVGILAAQEFDEMIPAGLPPGTRVAHKTGSITRIRHDAAIVYPDGASPYVLVVLTAGYDDPAEADAFGARTAEWVHALATAAR